MRSNHQPSPRFVSQFLWPWVICSIGMLFYCYNYFLRVSPSVMQTDLMQGLHITAYQFGTLASMYYWAYTPMQVPVGMLYDRFGTKIVQFFACLVAVLGVLIFINADNLMMAGIGRFCIGLGTAFAYIGVLKLASVWLAPNRFATVAGLTTSFGMLSAIFSDKYLTTFVQMIGYKNALHVALGAGIALSLLILFFMRSRPKMPLPHQVTAAESLRWQPLTFLELLQALRVVLRNPQMWIIGLIGCLFYMPASVFLDLWGIPYLKAVYHLTPEQAANFVSCTFVGWIIAGPSIGALSDKIKRRRLPLLICTVFSTILISAIFYIPSLSLLNLSIIFFLLGIFCGAHPLCFALGKENCPNHISGIAVAVTNTLIMLGGMVFEPLVGKLLDKHAVAVVLQNNIPVYTASDYTYALTLLPIGLMISVVLTLFVRETYCTGTAVVLQRVTRKNALAVEV